MIFLFATGAFAAMGEVQDFTFNGFGPGDTVGSGEQSGPDGEPDARFSARISGFGALTGLILKSPDEKSMWDTTPGNNIWGMEVRDSSGKVLSRSNERLSVVPFLGGLGIEISVADNGAIANGGKFTLTARFLDNSESSASITLQPVESQKTETATDQPDDLEVTFMGKGERDIVGRDERRSGNGKMDWRVDIDLESPGTVVGMRIANVEGPGGEWDTIPENGKWLIGVTRPDGEILNRPDGSIRIPVTDSRNFVLWLEDNGSLDKAETRSVLTVIYDDGRKMEQEIQGFSLAPGSDDGDFLEARLAGTGNADYVGKNENLEGNQNRDSRFDIRFRGTGILNAIRLVNLTKGGEWDTIPRNGKWLIAVKQPGGSILNAPNGSIRLSVDGTASLELWVEDNGTLDDPDSSFRVSLEFSDGRVLEKEIPSKRDQDVHLTEDRELVLSKPWQAQSDYVGPYDQMERNGKGDQVFTLKIRGKGTIDSMTLRDVNGSGVWDTIPGNGRWAMAVRGPGNRLLNHSNGSVSFPVPPNHNLHIFVEDNGSFQLDRSRYELTVTWDDGTTTKVRTPK
ncbi:MAG: hypothetical protein ACLFN0_08310 [Thermovirgaceae bacterium]